MKASVPIEISKFQIKLKKVKQKDIKKLLNN